MKIDEKAVVSAERSVEAVTWLRSLLAENVSATEAARQTAGLQLTPTAVQSMEALRRIVEERETQKQKRAEVLEATSNHYDSLRRKWEDAGASVVRDIIDPDALSETDTLADICTALKLDPGRSLSRAHQMTALSKLAEEYLAVEDRYTQRQYALGAAQQAVRDSVEELRNAADILDRITSEVQKKEKETETLVDRERAGQEDIEKQNEKMKEAEEMVKRAGIRPEFMHGKIAKDGERVEEIEKNLKAIKLDLEKYHGMPADMDICREMVSGMKKQIAQIDAEIEEAINSMN
ncbi:unnamed protein product [Agarophyton chilense]